MSKPNLDAVRDAIREFDAIGRAAFMARYGFSDRNIRYEVEFEGKKYPSKAIFGAAFGRMPGETARNSESCDGTEARRHLADLGLNIVSASGPDAVSADAPELQADAIRRFICETYVEAARDRGEATFEVVSGDVHTAMELTNSVPAVCSVLEGRRLCELAGLQLIDRYSPIGSDKPSSTIRYKFGFVDAGSVALDPRMLARLREIFLEKHPDFKSFADCPSFDASEGDYKQALVTRAAEIMAKAGDDATVGAALLDLASGKLDLTSNLIDWWASSFVDGIRAAHSDVVETAVGKMAKSARGDAAVIECVDELWPFFVTARASKPYAESRMVPTMVRALVDPEAMLGIRSTPTDNAHKMLIGRPAFASQPLNGPQLESVLAMAKALFRTMRDQWGWKPRSLWDVQGFIWETCQNMLDGQPTSASAGNGGDTHEEGRPVIAPPTNLILYGPPGTGKTYTTAREAVALCGEVVPNDRDELMAVYRSLQQRGRIGFVTFHQNFSYEDFVEGLRPVSGGSDGDEEASGFTLKPQDGIFKQMADLAASNRGKALRTPAAVIDRSAKIFKMSLGRTWASEDDVIYADAIRDGHIVLGYGGEVDWSDSRFDDWAELKARWLQDHPDATSNDPNVSQMYAFRIAMQIGSLVVVSDGNSKFRAIGVITGPYQFVPGPKGEYNHRRAVRWLWHGESLPRERIYEKSFSMVSVYTLNSEKVNWDGLEQIVGSGGDAVDTSGAPEPHVLVIDEINRANISKVFGELITLLEPDKRMGMPNALTLRLPYSKSAFGVPANLHVIGTMNTADRSIALLDTALRRRFIFREMPPRPDLLKIVDGIDLPKLLTVINQRIEYLLDREHRIGHAFFMQCKTRSEVHDVLRNSIIPLLQEYFFEDWSRIRAVLGSGFIQQSEILPPPGFDGPPRKAWSVRPRFAEDAYRRLITGSAVDNVSDDDIEADDGAGIEAA